MARLRAACIGWFGEVPICLAYDGGATRDRASRRLHASQSACTNCGLGYNAPEPAPRSETTCGDNRLRKQSRAGERRTCGQERPFVDRR
jgi:hypothetical protein